jgi:hypothetical protein
MAEGTQIELPLAGEPGGVLDRPRGPVARVGFVVLNVTGPVAVTLGAPDSELVAAGIPKATGDLLDGELVGVTLETARLNQATEVDLAILVPRTVDPTSDPGEV